MDITPQTWRDVHDAIRADDWEKFVDFLSRCPRLATSDYKGNTVACFASSKGKLRYLKELVSRGADVNFQSVVDGSPLQAAANEGHLEVIFFLMDNGAQIDDSQAEFNPLFNAIWSQDLEVVKAITAKCDPKSVYVSQDGVERCALDFAMELDSQEIVDYLIGLGCEPT